MTKATVAREWLWFVASLVVANLVTAYQASTDTSQYGGDYGEALILGTLWAFAVYLATGFVRLTWWAFTVATKSN